MKGTIIVELKDTDEWEISKIEEIFRVLIEKGALTGVKNGRTIIQFDSEGTFMGVELDYWPWKRRSS